MLSVASMEVPSSWDALRKQARKLEAQLDEQMNSYRKLVSSKDSAKADGAEDDLESGIDRLLKQLQQVNSQMQAWVSSGGSEMVSHTLTRHQEILQDLTQEFYRLRSSLKAKKEHASLLEDFREFDRTRLDLEDGSGSAEQALLKEHGSISRSTGQWMTGNRLIHVWVMSTNDSLPHDGYCNFTSSSNTRFSCSSTINIWWY